jgi:hypothetical protein
MKLILKVSIFMLVITVDFLVDAYTATCYCRNTKVRYVENVRTDNYRKHCERACAQDQGLADAELT